MDITKSTITVNRSNVNINGSWWLSSDIVVQAIDRGGNRITTGGEMIRITASTGERLETEDNNNGTYKATLTRSSPGTVTVSFYRGEAKSPQTALVSFYKPLGCQVHFVIKTDQRAKAARGRYRKVIEGGGSWEAFDIDDITNPSTPKIDEPGFYELEVQVQGTNDKWTNWYVCERFVIDCNLLAS